MPLNEIADILKQTIGLDFPSVGMTTINNAVERRMRACEITDKSAYLGQLRCNPEEQRELVEAVVIPETWFFRDRTPFEVLGRQTRNGTIAPLPGEPLRLLSIPCSSGEEPYTLAMALTMAGLVPGQYVIDAADVSRVALDKAARALYRKNSFRGDDLSYRDRFFTPSGDGYQLCEEIRGAVRFHNANILEPGFLPVPYNFDVIFCRNLLIYFDTATQQRAFSVLERRLNPNGLLFLGHAETPNAAQGRFVSVRYPRAYAYRKATAKDLRPPRPERQPVQPASKRASPNRPAAPVVRPFADVKTKPNAAPAATSEPGRCDNVLSQAAQLADNGQLNEAAQLCQQILQSDAPTADVYCLLGVIDEARDDSDTAEAYLRKALYLQPDHHEALLHLALLLERRGDMQGAARLHDRARRAEQRQSGTA